MSIAPSSNAASPLGTQNKLCCLADFYTRFFSLVVLLLLFLLLLHLLLLQATRQTNRRELPVTERATALSMLSNS